MRKRVAGVAVEWDDYKNRLNIEKHKINFETAALVFSDVNRVEFYDGKHSENEYRYGVIGMVNNLITVIYTERIKSLRIISARAANSRERKIYYGQNS